ncbi:MAG: septum site-determining protein MinC [Limnohabitans sp.]|nr:MAG: septum site-determining protein MinC [Limnohabitans sp.]
MPTTPDTSSAYDIKSADMPLVAFQLKSANLSEVETALAEQLRETPGFFDQDPALIDLDALSTQETAIDFPALLEILQKNGLRPVAVKSIRADWLALAKASGLVVADDARIRRQAPVPQTPVVPVMPALCEAMVLDRPLRSGQQFYAKGRDLVVLAMVNPGAEVLADGNIHVYAPLRGKAIAGARGYTGARIFAQNMDPELISIAGVYRTSENPLPADIRGHAAQVSLQMGADGERLVIAALKA